VGSGKPTGTKVVNPSIPPTTLATVAKPTQSAPAQTAPVVGGAPPPPAASPTCSASTLQLQGNGIVKDTQSGQVYVPLPAQLAKLFGNFF